MRALGVDSVIGVHDRFAWGESLDGSFSVKSAYAIPIWNSVPRANLSKLFHRVWKVVVPERVRMFLWLGIHQVIMTNVERHMRHLSSSDVCHVCKGGAETIMHILRDCPAMEGIWQRIVPSGQRRVFFEQTLMEWMYHNLGKHEKAGESVWSTLFTLAVWWGWKWRCGNVFGVNGKCRDRVKFLKDLAKEVTQANLCYENETRRRRERVETWVAWTKPGERWLKFNTDGAFRGNPDPATSGGVLRNERGEWCVGFAVNIVICSAPMAELWGVYDGLAIAWDRKVPRLELEIDSEMVVGFLTTGISMTHPLSFLVHLCHGFISRDWIVRIRHVYRKVNRLADGLANYAFTLPLGFHMLDLPPECIDSIVLEDVGRVAISRQVCL